MDNIFLNQTFGVEIEMYNISRETAAKLVADYFRTEAWDSANELKYHSWACKDRQERLWQFRRDTSIKPNILSKDKALKKDFSKVCELVTPVLCGEDDLSMLMDIVEILVRNGAKSDSSMQCSVHIHVGANGYKVSGVLYLLNLWSKLERDLFLSLSIDKYRIYRYCHPLEKDLITELNNSTIHKIGDFYKVWYKKYPDDINSHYNKSRYHSLNMHSLKCHGTIEYRLFEFKNEMSTGQLRAFILFCLGITYITKNKIIVTYNTLNDLINKFNLCNAYKLQIKSIIK